LLVISPVLLAKNGLTFVRTEELSSKHRHVEAGRVLLEYGPDIRAAVSAFVDGGLFSEARRVVPILYEQCSSRSNQRTQISKYESVSNLLEDLVYPGAIERCEAIGDEVSEVNALLVKQTARINELRAKRVEDSSACMPYHSPSSADVKRCILGSI
jgi:elongator complex protein 1